MVEAALALGRYLFLALLSIFVWLICRLLARDLDATQTAEVGPARSGQPRLVALRGAGMAKPGRAYPVEIELTIGRHPDSTIVLDDGFCSSHHARVWQDAGRCWIEDLGSRNGTLVNDQALPPNEAVALQDRATLAFGATVLRFER